ncbi:MAG TPA: cytochrome c-type biogenesis protein [Gammaproteobacteria bacterium]|nr:cytochrome c-type biogenesis protein [Gammaproteobacteria bacterium]
MKIFFTIGLILIPLQLFAAKDFYPFDRAADQQRFVTLTSQLRCLVCQNQNLAESNAPLASDLRQQIYQHIQQGQSDRQIVDYLVARYGDFILYKPPVNAATLGLWLSPLVFFLAGVLYLLFYIRKKTLRFIC